MIDDDLKRLKLYIQGHTGLSFKSGWPRSVSEAIRQQMESKKIDNIALYLSELSTNNNELNKLINLITITETYFFREPKQINLVCNYIFPLLYRSKQSDKPIKILSAGCSTGDEAYSLSIALSEKFYRESSHFSIIGFDINSNAIQTAQKGVYRKQSLRYLSKALIEKYFEPIDQYQYTLKPVIKDSVRFFIHNLLSDSYPEIFHNADIIFYRNVSIHFEPHIQVVIFKKLVDLLNPNGYIVTSSTETWIHNSMKVLPLVETDQTFLFHKITSTENIPHIPHIDLQQPNELSKDNFVLVSEPTDYTDNVINLAKEKKYHEAINYIDNLSNINSLSNAFPETLLLKAELLLNVMDFKQAKQICLEIIEKDELIFESYVIMGLIARFENDPKEAIKRFKQSLYVNRYNWFVHFHLGEIYQAEKKLSDAVIEYKTTINLIEKGQFQDCGLRFVAGTFSKDQIVRLCKKRILNASDVIAY